MRVLIKLAEAIPLCAAWRVLDAACDRWGVDTMAERLLANRFGFHGPYEPGTAAHEFWLTVYDRALAVMILNPPRR